MTSEKVVSIAIAAAQWTLAIAAILGTATLFTWIVVVVVKKDK